MWKKKNENILAKIQHLKRWKARIISNHSMLSLFDRILFVIFRLFSSGFRLLDDFVLPATFIKTDFIIIYAQTFLLNFFFYFYFYFVFQTKNTEHEHTAMFICDNHWKQLPLISYTDHFRYEWKWYTHTYFILVNGMEPLSTSKKKIQTKSFHCYK